MAAQPSKIRPVFAQVGRISLIFAILTATNYARFIVSRPSADDEAAISSPLPSPARCAVPRLRAPDPKSALDRPLARFGAALGTKDGIEQGNGSIGGTRLRPKRSSADA